MMFLRFNNNDVVFCYIYCNIPRVNYELKEFLLVASQKICYSDRYCLYVDLAVRMS